MTPSKDERLLREIHEDIELLSARVARYSAETFYQDRDAQDLIGAPLYRITDAAGQLSEELRDRHPEIDWRSIKGMRVVIAHGYRGMVLPMVWETVQNDIPELGRVIDRELARTRAQDRARDHDHGGDR